MALVKCPDCERDVSSRAVACPYCGCPISALAAQYFNEGEQYRVGKGAPQNDEKAVECYQKAAELGLAEAQNSLGEIYYDFGIMQSERIAKLIKEIVVQKAAEHGTESQCYEEAIKWYRKAAEQGYADAQCNLGDMYYLGWGVPEDCEEAAKWYQKAARQGNIAAQKALAKMEP